LGDTGEELPRRYQRFFEGQLLPTRYNKYLGKRNIESKPRVVINKEIIGPTFDFSRLEAYHKATWLVRDPRDRLISYILDRHYDYLYNNDHFVRQQLLLLEKKRRTQTQWNW